MYKSRRYQTGCVRWRTSAIDPKRPDIIVIRTVRDGPEVQSLRLTTFAKFDDGRGPISDVQGDLPTVGGQYMSQHYFVL